MSLGACSRQRWIVRLTLRRELETRHPGVGVVGGRRRRHCARTRIALRSLATRGKGQQLITALVYHRVAHYETWKLAFDEVVAGPLHDAVRSLTVWRGQDDPNLVILCETYASREAAEATFTNPAALAAMAEAGVDTSALRVEYLDEVAGY